MFTLAFRNIFRHKVRTGLTSAAIIFGVIGLIISGGFVHDTFIQLGEAVIHSQLGHIQIYKTGYYSKGSRSFHEYLVPDPEKVNQATKTIPEIDDVMSRLNFAGLLNNGKADLSIVGEGVEPDKEAKLGTFMKFIAGRPLSDKDVNGIVIGEGLAESLQLKPGDSVTLLLNTAEGSLNSADFEVIGLFQSFSKDFDARSIRIPLAAAQDLLGAKGANAIVVVLKDTNTTDQVFTELQKRLPSNAYELKKWDELTDFYKKTIELYRHQFGILQTIIFIMVFLSVANSVNISMFERTGEFGTLMALGNRRNMVFRLALVENILLGLIASTVGVVIGIGLALFISHIGIPMPPPPNANSGYTAFIRVVPSVIAFAFTVGFMATIIACLFPAYKVTRMPAVEALRYN